MKVCAAVLALALASGALAGCASTPASAPTGSTSLFLSKTNWVAESIEGTPIDGGRITLQFSGDDKVAGSAGCNRYFGGYKESGKALTLSGVGATKMACAIPLMAQETRYLAALSGAKNYALNDRGGLVINGGALVFRPDGS